MSPLFAKIGPFFKSDVNRRNYWLGVSNGVLFTAAEAFTEPYVVLTYFTSLLTNSNFLIGLVAPLRTAGWYLPQLLVSGFVQRRERKLPVYTFMSVIRAASWVVLIVGLWFLRDPAHILVMFFGVMTLARVSGGVCGLCFMDVVARVISPLRRGAFFSTRRLWGGILALVASLIVGWILGRENWVFPHQFAVLFGLFLVIGFTGVFLFTLIDEPAETDVSPRVDIASQLQRASRLPIKDRIYGRFLATRLLMVVSEMALPFYVVYARERLDAPAGMIGVYLTILTLSGLLTNLWAGYVSDRLGNRFLLLIACLTGLVSPILALLMGAWHSPPLAFVVVFALNGMYNTSALIGHLNFLLDIAPAGDRPIYVGTAHTLVGVGLLASSLGGALADWLGFEVLFGTALAILILATVTVATIPEPRSLKTPVALNTPAPDK